MYDPISVETALVSSGGDLLIQLTDGTIVNAGRVRGMPGPQGEQGEQGIRGAHGKDGIDGTNGAKWHTGVGAPEISVGENNDMYMDVASALLPIFQKVNGDWLFLANLKVPPSGGGGGQGGAAGGGGSIIIFPPPNPGEQPIFDNDGKPIQNGDLWYDPTTGHLWVYHNNQWTPIGDRPPVIISPDPPNFNSGSEDGSVIKYPIAEGDLWFDSDQLALYVAAEDEAGDLRWVITTPADRSVLQDEVDIPDLPFRFPSPKTGGGNPFDGMTVYNPVTKLWYVFNAGKNQWIDLPPGVNELSMTALLVRGPDGMDGSFAYRQEDRDRLGTDALCYVNADTHEDWTRMVIPNHDLTGFDWTLITTAIIKGDQVSLIQFEKEDDPDLPDYTLRSDHQVESNFTVVPPAGPFEAKNGSISFLVKEPPGDAPFFDEEVIIRFKAIVNTGEDEIYYQENAPDPITDPELTAGNIWIDSDDNKLYVWNGTSWSEVTACAGTEVGDYVLKAGDTMSGALTMDNADHIHMVNTDLDFQPKSADTGAGWDANVDRFLDIESMSPKLVANDGTETNDHGDPFGINFDIDDGNTWKNRLKISNRYGEIVTFFSGSGAQIKFGENQANGGFTPNLANTGLTSGIPILGIPTPDFDNSPGDIAVNKEYVDQRDEFLQNEIIELEEELDALAPSVERGKWTMNLTGIAANAGQMSLYDDDYSNVGNPTGLFADVKSIWLNEIDNAGTPHGFAGVEAGEFIELFVEGDPDYGLYQVVDIHDETNGAAQWWVIEVNFVRAYTPTSATAPGDIIRVKIFKAPEGGDASTFLNKYGDKVIDAVANVDYEWNKPVTFETKEGAINFKTPSNQGVNALTGRHFAVKTDLTTSSETAAFYVSSKKDSISYKSLFRVRANGKVQAGPDDSDPFIATEDNDVTTKKYVDDKIEELLARIGELEMAGGVPRNYHFEQVQVREGYNWTGYANAFWLWGDEWDQSSTQPGTSSRKLQIQLPNNSDGSPRWLIKPQGHIIINDFEQYYDQRKVGSIIFYPGKIEVKEYQKSYGPQTYYEITGDFAPTASEYSKYWSREAKVRMTFVGGSVEEVPTP